MNIRAVYLRGVSIRGVYLRGVNIRGVYLRGVSIRDSMLVIRPVCYGSMNVEDPVMSDPTI